MTVLIAIARRSGIEAMLRAYDAGMMVPAILSPAFSPREEAGISRPCKVPGHAHTPAQPQPVSGQYLDEFTPDAAGTRFVALRHIEPTTG